MAYSFPIALDQFFDGLPIRSQVFELSEALETSETGGGEVLTANYGPRLWEGTVSLITQTHQQAEQAAARVELLREAGASFFVYDFALPGPAQDPSGATLGAATPTILDVAANNKELKLAGLPAGYKITTGDRLAFSYSTGPVRYALHKVMTDRTAGAGVPAGTTNWIEVRPHIRPGAANGATVQLHKPFCKAVIVPGSVRPGTKQGRTTGGVTFRWRQTLR